MKPLQNIFRQFTKNSLIYLNEAPSNEIPSMDYQQDITDLGVNEMKSGTEKGERPFQQGSKKKKEITAVLSCLSKKTEI